MSDNSATHSVTFGFVGLDSPKPNLIPILITKVVEAAIHEGFEVEEIWAYVEHTPEYFNLPREDYVVDDVSGQLGLMPVDKLTKEWAPLKWRRQDIARVKDPKHKQPSQRTAKVISDKCCIVVIGTSQFCATVAKAHLKDIPEMRDDFNFELMYRLIFLKEHYHLDEFGEFYRGFLANTDHMWAAECINFFAGHVHDVILATRATTNPSLDVLLAAQREREV